MQGAWADDKSIRNFLGKPKEEDCMGDLDIDGKALLKRVLKKKSVRL
jgi:hypothetical protein